MEWTDSRRLPVAVLNERRRRAVMLRLSGMTITQVCTLAELARATVIAVIKAYQRGGWEAVPAQLHRGPQKGEGCILNAERQQAIRGLIHAHTPDELGLPFALWSRAAVSALVEKEYGMTLPVRTMGSYLQRWGFTPQRPLDRAYEQNPTAVRAWLDKEYPAIAHRAKAEGGEIYWGDETGLRSDDVRGRSYAPRGDTPVVRPCHNRENVGLMSAVTNRGTVRWMLLKQAMNPALLIKFLQRLARDARRKVFLVLDNLPAHHGPSVVAWLERHRDRIEVFYLPSYSPELNPDELLNADLKQAITKQAPTRHKGDLLINQEISRHLGEFKVSGVVRLCMKKDGRKLDRKAQEAIRLMAVQRVREGESASTVIASYGMNRTTIHKWLKQANGKGAGMRRLQARKATGRPRTLTGRQERQVFRWINGNNPLQYGLDFGLWTRQIVRDLVEREFGHRLSLASIGALLARLNLSPQKPLQRAYQRDPEAIERWQRETYPAIARRAKAQRADIYFWDEAGFRADAVQGTTWGVKGQTPVVQVPGQRQSISAASAVSAKGAFWFATYEGGLTGESFVALLDRLMHRRKKPLHLILDSLPAHKTSAVKDYVASKQGKLTLHYLPGYAPDLNPDELVWSHAKRTGVARRPLQAGEKLEERVTAQLTDIANRPSLVRSFFKHPSVAYISDS